MTKLILILIPLLIQVESGGRVDAIGDSGKARGILQIHAAAWADGCKELGVKWDYKTGSFDAAKSRAICKAYLTRYGRHYKKVTGRAPTLETLARTWNGGPYGWRKKSTLPYWRKVQRARKGK